LTALREVYFEHTALGDCAKCTAIDPETGIEVTIMGPVRARPRDLEQLALAKLLKRLKTLSF
jgi:hypothetical protein